MMANGCGYVHARALCGWFSSLFYYFSCFFDVPDAHDYPRFPTYLVDVLRRHTGHSIAPYASNATADVIANAYENLDDTD